MKIRYTHIIISLLILLLPLSNYARASFVKNLVEKESWYLPNYSKIQFAGNIGFMSIGLGYDWWKEKAQTDLMYGYVSESLSGSTIHTFTIKNTFRLYQFTILGEYNLSPIMGFSLSFEPGENAYMKVPDRYPEGYYNPNSFYACINLGLKTKFIFNENSHFAALELFTELNSMADYIYYNIAAKEDRSTSILSVALGVNVYF